MGNIIKHYGKPRRSGRYPWGSGDDPYQSEQRKNVKDLSDEELQKRLNRMEKEKRYRELYKSLNQKEETFVKKLGKMFLNDIIGDSGKKAIKTVLTGTTIALGADFINKNVLKDTKIKLK